MRCNSCGYYPSPLSTSLSLFLTSCGHLVCSKCLERQGASKSTDNTASAGVLCLVCKQPCKTVKLGPDAQPGPDVTFYFSDVLAQLKKIEQAIQFQNMHYQLRIEADKRERLLAEIGEAQRQEKELSEIEGKITSSQVSELLQALREKWGDYLTAEPKQGQSPFSHSRHGVSASPMDSQRLIQTPRSTVALHPSTSVPPNMYNSLTGHSYSVQGASLTTPTQTPPNHRPPPRGINTPPTSVARSIGPSSCDHRVRANLMSQAQMQHWAHQSVAGGKTPTLAASVHQMQQNQTRSAYGSAVQLQQHSLRSAQASNSQSVYSSPAVSRLSASSGGMSKLSASASCMSRLSANAGGMQSIHTRRNVAVGMQVPGSSLSQSMEF